MPTLSRPALAATVALSLAAAGCVAEPSSEARRVTVYSGRHHGIEAVFDEFTAATGIEVRFTRGSDPELRERAVG